MSDSFMVRLSNEELEGKRAKARDDFYAIGLQLLESICDNIAEIRKLLEQQNKNTGELKGGVMEVVEKPFGNFPKTACVIPPDAYVLIDDNTAVRFDVLVALYRNMKAGIMLSVHENRTVEGE